MYFTYKYQQQKRKNNIRFFSLFALLYFGFQIGAFAQLSTPSDKALFFYDAAGNRIQRKYNDGSDLPPDGGSAKKGDEATLIVEMEDTVSIVAFPNPTVSEFNITLKNTPEHARVTIVVSDMSGKKIRVIEQAKNTEYINLEGLSKGIYIVDVAINDKKKSLKIIKQ